MALIMTLASRGLILLAPLWRLFDLQIVAYAIFVEAGSLPCEPCMD